MYASPAVQINRIVLEGLIAATTRDIEFATGVDPQNLSWTADLTIGGGENGIEGGDLYLQTW
jgi:hypothetical protein